MSVQKNAALVPQLRNAALFAAATKQFTFTNIMTGAPVAPKGTTEVGRVQTDPGYPVVRVTDLEKQKGQEITVDLVHEIAGKPTMGDKKLAGRGDTISFADDKVGINQGRHMVDNGGGMFVQTVGQDINAIAQKVLKGWYKRLDEETTLYHLAGARGTEYTPSMIVPPDSDPEFAEIMVNPVLAPTFSRHLYGGDAQSIEQLDSADLLSLGTIDNLSLYLEEMSNPIGHIRLAEDELKDEDPFYVLWVTPRQWYDLQQQATTKDYNQLVASASNRQKGFSHSLFKGDVMYRNGILIKKMSRYVRFAQGSQVRVSLNNKNATTTLRTVGTNVERAILLGSQAMAYAMGHTETAKSFMSIHQETVDHGNTKEYSIAFCYGKKALRFKDRDGWLHDHGRLVIDTAVSPRRI